ncbi:putative nucleotide-diphospho-sugar transferase [Profundibacterium mesophilum]|uniref:Nucleotide-diphospho-sugar transferase domain containing protein n=1 Tax=Profundibacterium mesophilum KAUST100406-0324 TaxID=1037889 RepID=A0A921NP52_9RHOB|nr:putative nucleotide-diphospho-sugar transferase [Profundibacterium mesophilum]KAF0675052.1 Nucleotide-diphospho-sugar transferase domain containing protein [Profundibacterium mesophilum KAUST100406-0324]
MSHSTGVIYVATGDDYRNLARASVSSLKRSNPGIAADLFTDQPDAPGLDAFDQVHPVPRNHKRAKLDCMPLSRFDRTLFLDCDTLVIAPLGDLFFLLDRFELAMAHDVRRASALIQEGDTETTPYAFPQLNSGVVLYRKSAPMLDFFDKWAESYRTRAHQRDQIALKDLLWSSDIRFYVLPPEFNLRRVTLLDAWEPLDARPTIIHSHRLLDHLTGLNRPRVADVETLVMLEREALQDEWRRLGVPDAMRREIAVLLEGISEGRYRGATRQAEDEPAATAMTG